MLNKVISIVASLCSPHLLLPFPFFLCFLHSHSGKVALHVPSPAGGLGNTLQVSLSIQTCSFYNKKPIVKLTFSSKGRSSGPLKAGTLVPSRQELWSPQGRSSGPLKAGATAVFDHTNKKTGSCYIISVFPLFFIDTATSTSFSTSLSKQQQTRLHALLCTRRVSPPAFICSSTPPKHLHFHLASPHQQTRCQITPPTQTPWRASTTNTRLCL